MLPTARVSDMCIGVCVAHKSPQPVSGVIITGARTKKTEGMPTAQITSMIVTSCGHSAVVMSGSAKETSECLFTSRLTDNVVGPFTGVISSGAVTNKTG